MKHEDPARDMMLWLLIVCLVVTIAITRTCDGQVIRRPACDCPAPGTIGCEIAPDACAQCWDECPPAWTIERRVPDPPPPR